MLSTNAYVLILAGLSLTACRSFKPSQQEMTQQSKYCEPAFSFAYDSTYFPHSNIQTVLQTDSTLNRLYSAHDIQVANATGVLPLLEELEELKKSSKANNPLEILMKRQQVINQLLLASIQVSSVAAELDCEAERAYRLATYLDQKQSKRVRRLTILSVVTGAGTTVASALIQPDTPNKAVSIGGGLLSACLGGMAAFSSKKAIQLNHQRNLLTDIWNQNEQSSVYPPFVWYVLNEKSFSYSGKHSISYNTRQRWQDYVLVDSSAPKYDLYFGEGGNYQADDLYARAEMLNQLQSAVRLINQDLQSMLLNFSK